jgi:hypothetical protein
VRRLGVLVFFVLAGGVVAAAATASPADDPTHLTPASSSTSTDHAPACAVPGASPLAGVPVGGTLVTFTLVPPGCD